MIALIVARASNGVIGKDGAIPWYDPVDLKWFKDLTMGHTVIMGRKTYESIGRPLKGRRNIIVSRNLAYEAPTCDVYPSMDMAIMHVPLKDKIFIIGGGEIYTLGMVWADEILITQLDEPYEGDTYFPEIKEERWDVEQLENNVFKYTRKT